MKILVAHDREEVSEKIAAMVLSLKLPEVTLTVSRDGVSTKAAMQRTAYDLAIMDLTLPYIVDRTPISYTVAEQLLQEIFASDTILAPGDIIGITKEIAALNAVRATIAPHLMSIIEEADGAGWLEQLGERIRYVARYTKARQRSTSQQYDVDAMVITALDKEILPLKSLVDFTPDPSAPGVSEFVFPDSEGNIRRGVALSIGRAGQAAAAAQTAGLIARYRPKLCLMTGFCGGPEGKVKEGDIVLFEQVFNWDCGKWIDSSTGGAAGFEARPDPINIIDTDAHRMCRQIVEEGFTDEDVLAKAQRLSGGIITSPSLMLSAAASGSAVVGHKEIMEKISGLSGAIRAVDMESYGFYYASKNTPMAKPSFLCVKSVADFCDGSKGDKLHDACCHLSAHLIWRILHEKWIF